MISPRKGKFGGVNIVDLSKWKERVNEIREEKDRFFQESPDSPVPDDHKSDFEGLDYYPPDPDYRFELELEEYEDKSTLQVEVSGNGKREYICWGVFRFEIDGEEEVLRAYKREPDEEGFFVPFRDGTSGNETYGAGRYLDLSEEDQIGGSEWILDFNKAYNPWCAYSDAYSCPLPPTDNWLDVAIRAGEKKYPLKDK